MAVRSELLILRGNHLVWQKSSCPVWCVLQWSLPLRAGLKKLALLYCVSIERLFCHYKNMNIQEHLVIIKSALDVNALAEILLPLIPNNSKDAKWDIQKHSRAQQRDKLWMCPWSFPVQQQCDINDSALKTHLPKILPEQNANSKSCLSRLGLSCCYKPGETSQSSAYLAKVTEQDYIIQNLLHNPKHGMCWPKNLDQTEYWASYVSIQV